MKYSFIIKINFLILGLFLVIFVMSKSRSGSLANGISSLLGLPQPPPPPGAVAGVTSQLDWCDTRVTSLERPGKPTIQQQKLKWMWLEGETSRELNFVAVEKWFGQFCRVGVQRVGIADFDEANATQAMNVVFIKGPPEALLRSANGVFRWRQEIFRSDELDRGLSVLDNLPNAGARTTH